MSMSQQQPVQPQQRGNPPVVLHARPHQVDGGVEWSLDFKNDPPRGKVVDVDLPARSGAHEIHIHLVQAPGIRFSASEPIWVAKDGECPPPAGSTSAQIRVLRCEDKKLVLHDQNDGEACTLAYQLNFDGAPPFDPMIRNGGSY